MANLDEPNLLTKDLWVASEEWEAQAFKRFQAKSGRKSTEEDDDEDEDDEDYENEDREESDSDDYDENEYFDSLYEFE